MNDEQHVCLSKDQAEELEAFLRMLENHAESEEGILAFRAAGLVEAANGFANMVEMALDEMREEEPL